MSIKKMEEGDLRPSAHYQPRRRHFIESRSRDANSVNQGGFVSIGLGSHFNGAVLPDHVTIKTSASREDSEGSGSTNRHGWNVALTKEEALSLAMGLIELSRDID